MYENRVKTKNHLQQCTVVSGSFSMSGRPDSNWRPLAPHASTLANCATPRYRCGYECGGEGECEYEYEYEYLWV